MFNKANLKPDLSEIIQTVGLSETIKAILQLVQQGEFEDLYTENQLAHFESNLANLAAVFENISKK